MNKLTQLQTEEELYAWCLTQRLLAGSGVLKRSKQKFLDGHAPEWLTPISLDDEAYAFRSRDKDLEEAFEAWWNATHRSPMRLTIDELRLRILVDPYGKEPA
jgi:hypothetical protein